MGFWAAVLAAGAVLLAAVLSLCLAPLRFHVSYRWQGRSETVNVLVTIWGSRFRYPYQVTDGPPPRHAGEREPVDAVVARVFAILGRLIPAANTAGRAGRELHRGTARLVRSARFLAITWDSELAHADPARVGVYTGYAWAVKGMALGRWRRLRHPPATLRARAFSGFCRRESSTQLTCIFELRGGHIISAALPLLSALRERR